MVLKERICEAFCEGVQVATFKGGLAVSTSHLNVMGDRLGVYAMGPSDGVYRLIDNALTVAVIEADGTSITSGARGEALASVLAQHGAEYDSQMGEIFVAGVSEAELPKAILDFMALLMRVNDLMVMTKERVKNAFEDDYS